MRELKDIENIAEVRVISKNIIDNLQGVLNGKVIDIALPILFDALSIVILEVLSSLNLPLVEKSINIFMDTLKESILDLVSANNLNNKVN